MCIKCKRTWTDHEHDSCPRGGHDSTTWVDISTCEMTCDKCHEVWQLEENIFYCPCGHIQKTEYSDTAAILEGTGTVAVARNRNYINDGY